MRTLLITIAIAGVVIVASAQTARTTLKLGDKAPDFALPNGDGKLVTLSEFTARTPVVLVFYRGFW